MKLSCPCGHVISDNGDFLGYKARFIADQDYEDMINSWVNIIDQTKRLAAIVDLDERHVAESRLRTYCWHLFNGYDRTMYQCRDCGRIFIDDVEFQSHLFSPQDRNVSRRLFRSIRGDSWYRHLVGDWLTDTTSRSSGTLQWGTDDPDSGFEEFSEWDSLVARYHEVFESLRERDILRRGWLRRDRETIHIWCRPTPFPEPLRP